MAFYGVASCVPLWCKMPSQPHSAPPPHWNAFGKQLNCVNKVPFVEMAVTPPKPWLDLNLIVVFFFFKLKD